jgi:hypothetical protein
VPLSIWNEVEDTFEHADQSVLDELACWIGLTPAKFTTELQKRIDCLTEFSQGQGLSVQEMYEAIELARLADDPPANP